MMDVTPLIPAGRQVVQAYGDGGFRITGVRHEGSVIVFADRVLAWPVASAEQVDAESLGAVFDAAGDLDILLLGCGRNLTPLPAGLRAGLRARGVMVEPMDTGAACRTYNILLSEERRVAAALIAV